MSDKLTADIRSAIEKNLTSEMSGVLKKMLTDAETAVADKERLTTENKNLVNQINEQQKEISRLKTFETKHNETLKQAEEAADAQRELKLTLAEMKAKNAEEKVSMMAHLVGQVFKSPVYKTEINRSVNENRFGPYNSVTGCNEKSGESISETRTLVEEN